MAGWTTPWAPTASELAACVECGLCLPHCPTFRLTGDETASPRGRLRAMAAVAAGDLEIDAAFDSVVSLCLQCRACEAACPSLVPFGRAMEGARAEVLATRPRGRRLRARVVGRWISSRRLVSIATFGAALAQRTGRWVVPRRLRPGLVGLRPLGWRRSSVIGYESPSGSETVGLLAGCVMDPWFEGVQAATIRLLERAGHRVVVPTDQTCCGALAAHEGAAPDARRMAERNRKAFVDVDRVVVTAAGCSAHMAEYDRWGASDLTERISDVLIVIAAAIEDGHLPTRAPDGKRVAVHDPCHHRHAQGIVDAPRAILRAAGYEVVDVDPSGMCCGAAGAYSITHPATAAVLGETKAAEARSTRCDVVASANPGCEMQLRAHLGGDLRVAHPIELYAEAVDSSV